MSKRRRSPRKHTVHPKHRRYNVSQYPRGEGGPFQKESMINHEHNNPTNNQKRSVKYRIPRKKLRPIGNYIHRNYPKGEKYPKLDMIGIFGSQAYGIPKKDSDIDVIIVARTNDWRFHSDLTYLSPYTRKMEEHLSKEYKREVNITTLPKLSRWEDFLTSSSKMNKAELISKSIWLYDASSEKR